MGKQMPSRSECAGAASRVPVPSMATPPLKRTSCRSLTCLYASTSATSGAVRQLCVRLPVLIYVRCIRDPQLPEHNGFLPKGAQDCRRWRLASAAVRQLHLRRPRTAPAGGLDILAGKELARSLRRATRALIERAVRAGAPGGGALGALRILDVEDRLRLGRCGCQERSGPGTAHADGERRERDGEREALQQVAAREVRRAHGVFPRSERQKIPCRSRRLNRRGAARASGPGRTGDTTLLLASG